MNVPTIPLPTACEGLTLAALLAIAAIAWAFLVRSEAAMTSMAGDGPLAGSCGS